MRTSLDRTMPLADLGNQGRASTESDTSAHSYDLKDVVITEQREASPFASSAYQRQNALAAPLDRSHTEESARESARSAYTAPTQTTRRGSRGMRVSLELPPDRAIETLDDALIQGKIVKRRRRLPIGVVVFFGMVSVSCLLIALTTLSIGLYNFTKLRMSRAAKTVDALSADISPLIHAIYDKLFNTTTKPQ